MKCGGLLGCGWLLGKIHPGKKTVWFAWMLHFACYVVFLACGSKSFQGTELVSKFDPYVLVFFLFPVILVAFFLFHSLFLLVGWVDPWTSYWHSGVVTCSSFVLPYQYLVFGLYTGRICWPGEETVFAALPGDLCGDDLRVSVGFAFASVGTLGFFGLMFMLFVRKQDDTRRGGDGTSGVSRSFAMGSLIRDRSNATQNNSVRRGETAAATSLPPRNFDSPSPSPESPPPPNVPPPPSVPPPPTNPRLNDQPMDSMSV